MSSFKQITISTESSNHPQVSGKAKAPPRRVARRRNSSPILWYRLACKLKQRLSPSQKQEISRLKWVAWPVIILLLLLLIGSTVLLVLGLSGLASANSPSPLLLARLSLVAGLAGSTVSALISLADRFSHGWELDDGAKVPRGSAKPDRFVGRMVPWFIIRPFLGAIMGLAIYIGLSAGLIIGVGGSEVGNDIVSALRLTFFALLAGLFAKKFLDSLRSAFAAFVGADKNT